MGDLSTEHRPDFTKHHPKLRDGVFGVGGERQAVLADHHELMLGSREHPLEPS